MILGEPCARVNYGSRARTLCDAGGDGPMHAELRVQRLRATARVPARGSAHATGLDLFACLDAPVTLTAAPKLVPTGIALEFEPGLDVQVRPRSGLTSKGVGVALGTIDADYRGELMVTMWTFGGLTEWVLRDGDRIAQLVVTQSIPVSIVEAQSLTPTERGDGGHGSTGR